MLMIKWYVFKLPKGEDCLHLCVCNAFINCLNLNKFTAVEMKIDGKEAINFQNWCNKLLSVTVCCKNKNLSKQKGLLLR